MATPRKPRPTFDAPKPATPAASTWAYRSAPDAPVSTPVSTSVSTPGSTPSVLNRVVTTPVMLAALLVLAPLSWLVGPSRPR